MRVTGLRFVPVKCGFLTCNDPSIHGDLTAIFDDGSSRAVDSTGLVCHENLVAIDPKTSPDRKNIGRCTGQHQQYYCGNFQRFVPLSESRSWQPADRVTFLYFGPTNLVIYRNGAIVANIKPIRPFIQKWQFTSDHKYVAISAMWAHGIMAYELHSLRTGLPVTIIDRYVPDSGLPKWARELDKL